MAMRDFFGSVVDFFTNGVNTNTQNRYDYNDSEVYYEDEEENIADTDVEMMVGRPRSEKSKTNILDFQTARQLEPAVHIVISCPETLQEATHICDHLIDNEICVIKLKDIDGRLAQRIADYLGGVGYALKCAIERVDENTFVMAPSSTKITADLKSQLKSGSIIKTWMSK